MTVRICRLWIAALCVGAALAVSLPSGAVRSSGEEPAAALRRAARKVVQWQDTARLPLGARIRSREEQEGLVRERLTYIGAPGQVVPALVMRPAGATARLPVVIALHGLGGSKEGMRGWMEELARKGYLALAIDARWHGERGPGLQQAMIRAYRSRRGHPYVFDTVSDLIRALDYL